MKNRIIHNITDSEISEEIIDLMKVLAETNRMRIVQIMFYCSEYSVTELARLLQISQPATSQHLKILKQAGIVNMRKEGRQMIYYIDNDEITKRYGRGIMHLKRFFKIDGDK